jgi:hypothetical protein
VTNQLRYQTTVGRGVAAALLLAVAASACSAASTRPVALPVGCHAALDALPASLPESPDELTAAAVALGAIPRTTTAGDIAFLAGADAGFAEGTTQSGDATELADMNGWDADAASLVSFCKGTMSTAQQAAATAAANRLAGRLATIEGRYGIDQVQAEETGGAAGVTVAQLSAG